MSKPASDVFATAAQVEKLVRTYRSVDGRTSRLAEQEQAMTNHAMRELNYYHDDDGSLVIRARLPAEEGAIVLQALNAAMDAQHARGNNDTANDVTAETLAAGDAGRCELYSGPRLAPDTARRIACDSSLLRITDDAVGNSLDIGRKTRAVPPAMQRALRSRDHGCRFPGYTHDRFLDAHHIRRWANGGETSLNNLALLCCRHHRLVHEGGFGVERIADGALRFTRHDGRVIVEHPRLPDAPTTDGLHNPIFAAHGKPIDTVDWIIPEAVLNLDLAISGLMRIEERGREWPRVSEQ